MSHLILAITLTLGISAFCSLLEAFILSITTAEIEGFKKAYPARGKLLERFKSGIDETSSSILTLNTIANTAGATLVGTIAAQVLESHLLGYMTAALTLGILFFSEIFPKNFGVVYRKQLAPILVYPLHVTRIAMKPFSFFAKKFLTSFMEQEKPSEEEQEEEIRLMAERSAKSGALSAGEVKLISNAMSLDDISVESIMTPRTVVTFLRSSLTVEEVCRDFKNIPFARIPIYGETIDDIQGIVRRRDILQAFSEEQNELALIELKGDVLYVPETASGLQTLQQFMKNHQQIGVVVDEYGSTAGVITMEDIVEHLIGDEIYEDSDLAVDMRELAKKRAERIQSLTQDSSVKEEGSSRSSRNS